MKAGTYKSPAQRLKQNYLRHLKARIDSGVATAKQRASYKRLIVRTHKNTLADIKARFTQFGKVKITEEKDNRTEFDNMYYMEVRLKGSVPVADLYIAMNLSGIKRFFVPSFSRRIISLYIHLDR